MYLVDTNVWLERLLEQERFGEVRRFLDSTETSQIFLTLLEGAVSLVQLSPEDTQELVQAMQQFRLDFDDAYQYVAARKHGLALVSFDTDFDRTERGRKQPHQVTT